MSKGPGLPVYPSAEAPRYWRSLEERAGEPGLEEESAQLLEYAGGLDRRELLKSLGVSMALAGLTAGLIYNIAGNHDASPFGAPTSEGKEANWWFRKWADPLGEHSPVRPIVFG